jgi:hypothetical protein
VGIIKKMNPAEAGFPWIAVPSHAGAGLAMQWLAAHGHDVWKI